MIAATWILFFAIPIIYKKLVWDPDITKECQENRKEQEAEEQTDETEFDIT